MATSIVILGAGMVGSAMAMDLAREGFDVTVVDARASALARVKARFGVKTIEADLGSPAAVRRVIADYDVVCGALSSVIGLQTLKTVIEAKKPYCDISFMPEDAIDLDELAKKNGVTAVVDCGVAPGMSNMMAGYATKVLAPCRAISIFVGGLPVERRWPYEYKAGFAPHDVIEEYVRPSRIVEQGHIVVKDALSEPELLDFPGIGTLEAFNTDGLRSLAYTLDVPFMKEKTMRYPGHIQLMKAMRELGLFSKEPLDVNGTKVRPLDMTASLLFREWTYEEREADLTVMRVIAEGDLDGERTRLTWDLLDYYDPATDFRSMSRTTAFPATIVAGMIARGEFKRPGVSPPEFLGMEPGVLDRVLQELARRGVKYSSKRQKLG